MKFTVWLIPPEPVYSQIKSIIDRLSSEYKGPSFEPHMTLLGGFSSDNLSETEEKVKDLAKFDKLDLTLGPVSFSTTYFQSVFVRVNSTTKLMQLNLDAKKMFGRENDVFMPHISLLYGDHDMVMREKAASSVELPSASFVVDKFSITPADSNDPKDWKIISTISFIGRGSGFP